MGINYSIDQIWTLINQIWGSID